MRDNLGFGTGFNFWNYSTVERGPRGTKRRRNLTPALEKWCWDNKSHICNICGKRVTKITEAEFDHTRAYSKSGATNLSNVRIVHKACNRIKGKKSLSETKKLLGIKNKTRKRKKTTYSRKASKNVSKQHWINPLTGRKEEFRFF